jgi:hypothetical protein
VRLVRVHTGIRFLPQDAHRFFYRDLALPFEILVFLLKSADLRDHLLRTSLLALNLGRCRNYGTAQEVSTEFFLQNAP